MQLQVISYYLKDLKETQPSVKRYLRVTLKHPHTVDMYCCRPSFNTRNVTIYHWAERLYDNLHQDISTSHCSIFWDSSRFTDPSKQFNLHWVQTNKSECGCSPVYHENKSFNNTIQCNHLKSCFHIENSFFTVDFADTLPKWKCKSKLNVCFDII